VAHNKRLVSAPLDVQEAQHERPVADWTSRRAGPAHPVQLRLETAPATGQIALAVAER